MSQMTNVLLKADNPKVDVTYVPVTDTPSPIWRTQTAGVSYDGQSRLIETLDVVKSGQHKHTLKLEVPVMETLGASGAATGYVAPPAVAHIVTVMTTVFSDKRATDTDIANAVRQMAHLISGATDTTNVAMSVTGAVASDWATSVAPGVNALVRRTKPF